MTNIINNDVINNVINDESVISDHVKWDAKRRLERREDITKHACVHGFVVLYEKKNARPLIMSPVTTGIDNCLASPRHGFH
ncbi:hypothetical protein EAI_13452 [Harpegnathos saltator]|uniref:Uncharacterized protein n=1 Tax=Harpegnathos saltator TaxID=610380 RepID=E2B2S8_HARSA|nr:hypothetical protein EAI_13452 [Harpegnathos saltator]